MTDTRMVKPSETSRSGITDPVALLRASEKFLQWKPMYLESLLRTNIIATSDLMKDKHYTPAELARLWGVSVQTIREIFRSEEGVLKIGRNGTRTRRAYKTLRIPESGAGPHEVIGLMLTLFRWHVKKCHHDSRDSKNCQCPIWMDWTLPDGKRIRKSLGLRDWQAAQKRARDMEAEGIETAGEAVTIQKAIDAFEADAKTTFKPPTLKQYKIVLGRLNAYAKTHGYLFLKQLGVVEVREFHNSWTTYSPRTAGKHIERLKRFFKWCVENR